MKSLSIDAFKQVWLVDFEYIAAPGGRPVPVCLVARELHSQRKIKLWLDQVEGLNEPPYDIGEDSLFIAYYASAEFSCHLALGWALPVNVIDLFAEYRNLTNSSAGKCPSGLLDAKNHFGLGHSVEAVEKARMRDLILTGGPWTTEEQQAILDYCETDVVALEQLLPRIMDTADWKHALLRGRYMKAVACIEHNGIPVDAPLLARTLECWPQIRAQLIAAVDVDYGVYEGSVFKKDRFAQYLAERGIIWPTLASGSLELTQEVFKEMAKRHPGLAPLRALRSSLSKLKSAGPSIGPDDRNRYMLSPFSSITGRNQPSSRAALFGNATWMRGFIKAPPGYALVYIDWSQQEFGIAAALSGDLKMQAAYSSGDPYLEFAKQAKSIPPEATKATHPNARALFKECVLAVQYGMGAESLAQRTGQTAAQAQNLLDLHRRTYKGFWGWIEDVLDYAALYSKLETVFGWRLQVKPKANWRSLQNFLMQANGAEMLRLACIYGTEAGIKICAPVHDAVLIEVPLNSLEETVEQMQQHMARASELVLSGFTLRSDVEVFSYPERYADPRGQLMWDTVLPLVTAQGEQDD
ncbi:MAG: DNA polymerase I [Gammaproteobacteria bacterium]|nr:DNA polymerase I [Gammaproteobacteria bacterium]MBQ0841319.1 DNA polymerase I [Gammaproteobacteria bacterium]